ncbi:DMT family transporter [Noviherbaspirillum aridicola]|uniref:Transporter n=1 Tax=Noviherbaspirillum aridicola TaxID=2849687 RepID=A0ABQ4Q0S6_9BURK|nr:DMT family transporter [Noviherbaspirillum aridicola]GIZ50761.1 transporter [Noviherbaspirillum aridicola]
MTAADLAKLVFLSAIWGGSFIFLRVAVPEAGPLLTSILRTVLAGLALLAYARISGVTMDWRRNLKAFALVGLFAGAIPFTCFSYAALVLPAAYSAVLNATAPLFSALLSVLMLGERLTLGKLAGLLMGIGGVAILVGAGTLAVSPQTLLAVGACLVAAMCYAMSTMVVKKTGRPGDIHPIAMAAGSLALGGSMMLPALPFALPPAIPSPTALACILAMALLSSGLAQALFIPMIVRIGPTRAMSVSFLIPLFSMVWGVLFLGETVGAATIVGGVVVLLAMALVLSSGRQA